MHFTRIVAGTLCLFVTAAAFAKGPAYTDPEKADADFLFRANTSAS